jgi:hypothetical protein
LFTVIVAAAGAIPVAFAVSVVDPAATLVTGIAAESWPAGTVTLAGTVAMPVLAVDRLRLRPLAGAGADRFSVMFCVVFSMSVSEVG